MDVRPSPEETRPPLTRRGHAWRMVGATAIGLVVWSGAVSQEWSSHRTMFWVEVVCGLAALTLVVFHRRAPVTIALVTAALSSVSGMAAGAATLAGVSVATLRRPVPIIVVGLVNFVAASFYERYASFGAELSLWFTLLASAVINSTMMGWGMFIGSRRELMWTLHQRVTRAETEQSLRVAQGRSHERERIAREMHDVLAHRLTQVSMQAGALSFRQDLDSAALRSGLGDIQSHTNEALRELRGVLGVLRDEDGRLADAPQPTYDDIAALIEASRKAGLNVEYDDSVDRRDAEVPAVVGRAVYRIVQESLTNASKHAPGALVSVRISGDPASGLDVLVRNPIGFAGSGTPGAGLGLVGLTERAKLRGGTLRHGRDGSLYVVHASLPWAP